MNEEWRQWLYPLGILPAILFAGRYLLQWLTSEKLGKSVVMPLFWQLSITANLLLLLHSLVQLQFHVCVVQACSGVIAWRNLNLMQPLERHVKFSSVVCLLIGVMATIPLLFVLSAFLTASPIEWFRSPLPTNQQIPGFWHMTGFLGLLLFNGRFWVQWWNAERDKRSYLGVEFWWMSVLGSILCFCYFTLLGDVINMIGPIFGLVPSIRNLILIRRAKE
ncbi:MAG: lipid-A-disaccharide synthase N-terminal domain-containing protein [Parachlamydiaceae bacterium]